jgi:hypothetical protein
MIFSSRTTGSFHDPDLGPLPEDAVEITPELHKALMRGQSASLKINFDTAPPSLIERPPPSSEQLADIERDWRDGQLAKTDAVVARHRDELEGGLATSLKDKQYSDLQIYRRQLRDWPQGEKFPLIDHRPIPPDWLMSTRAYRPVAL